MFDGSALALRRRVVFALEIFSGRVKGAPRDRRRNFWHCGHRHAGRKRYRLDRLQGLEAARLSGSDWRRRRYWSRGSGRRFCLRVGVQHKKRGRDKKGGAFTCCQGFPPRIQAAAGAARLSFAGAWPLFQAWSWGRRLGRRATFASSWR